MDDIELYNACMNYCKMYGTFVLHHAQLNQAKLISDKYELYGMEKQLEFEKERLMDCYNRIYNIINKLEKGD